MIHPTLAFTRNQIDTIARDHDRRLRKLNSKKIKLDVHSNNLSHLNRIRLAVRKDVRIDLALNEAKNIRITPGFAISLIHSPTPSFSLLSMS